MAYLASIERRCQTCGRRATVQLVSNRNDRLAVYCATDGKRALARRFDVENKELMEEGRP